MSCCKEATEKVTFIAKRECRTNLKFWRILHSVRYVSLGRKERTITPAFLRNAKKWLKRFSTERYILTGCG